MDLSLLFYICSYGVVPCWLLLGILPRWVWTHRIATFFAPVLLGSLYLGLFLGHWNPDAGFGSLDQVYAVFQNPAMVLVGWIHYLVFDLFIGSWEVRDAHRVGISHALVIPCLVATFLMGPVGLLLYLLLRLGVKKKLGAED